MILWYNDLQVKLDLFVSKKNYDNKKTKVYGIFIQKSKIYFKEL